MEWNLPTTVGSLVLLVAVGAGVLIAAPIPMATGTILMMVVPSMLVFGAVALALGVKHGEWRGAGR
jgi:cytochrome c oxidase assembly factor CtaG